jgi:hypothetical protein
LISVSNLDSAHLVETDVLFVRRDAGIGCTAAEVEETEVGG